MVTCITRSEMPSFKVKIESSLWLLVTCWLLVTIKHSQT